MDDWNGSRVTYEENVSRQTAQFHYMCDFWDAFGHVETSRIYNGWREGGGWADADRIVFCLYISYQGLTTCLNLSRWWHAVPQPMRASRSQYITYTWHSRRRDNTVPGSLYFVSRTCQFSSLNKRNRAISVSLTFSTMHTRLSVVPRSTFRSLGPNMKTSGTSTSSWTWWDTSPRSVGTYT